METFYFADIDKTTNRCVAIISSTCDLTEFSRSVVQIPEEDHIYLGKEYVDGVWGTEITAMPVTEAPQEVTLESLSERIEALTKLLEENNITA